MRKALLILTLLCVTGLIAMPVDGAEFRVTGFFDQAIPHFGSNLSAEDEDVTQKDEIFFARLRSRFFLNFIASDDLRGVFALETDNCFGEPSRNCPSSRSFARNQTGFDLGIDNNNLEIKQLYVDFRVPQIPIGNRFNIGGFPANVTPLHSTLIFSNDAGGGNLRLDFTDQISLLVHYIQLEEDLDRFAGSTKVGEDYVASGTLMLKPLPGLDLHLPMVFGHLQQPFGSSLTGSIGAFGRSAGATVNVATEDRYYVGFDSRYRLGNLRIEPTFIYLFGDRKFTDGSEIDFNAFGTQLSVQYALGPWSFQLKGVYSSGNKATDDINNTQAPGSKREDVERFFPLSTNNSHRFGENFEILGRQVTSFRPDFLNASPGDQAGFDRFGLIHVGLRPQYKLTDNLTLEGAVGAFWTVENTACPAVLRQTSTTDPRGFTCTNPLRDFTGNSKHLGTEVDVGTIYTIMPGLTWQTRFGWAFLGDAFELRDGQVRDAWVVVNRLLYTF